MPLTPIAIVARLAARQDGLITRRQALEAGVTPYQIKARLRSGEWVQIGYNVYLVAGVPRSTRQALRACVLASGGAASHRSAAWLHDLVSTPPGRPELTVVPARRYRNPAATVHRQLDVTDADVTEVSGIRCTEPYETLLSLGIVVPQALHERALDRALNRGLIDYDRLVAHYFRKAKQGRDGGGRLHDLLAARDPEMPPAESDLETLLLRVLRDAGLPSPQRQVPLVLGGRTVRFDLAYPPVQVAIEGDGFGIHTIRGTFETDRSRHNAVVLAGWLPLHFTWRMIVHDRRYIRRTVLDALRLRGFPGV